MLIGKLLEGFRAEVLDAFFKGMNPRRMQSIKISYASGASIGITGPTLEEACFLLSGKGDGSKLPPRSLNRCSAPSKARCPGPLAETIRHWAIFPCGRALSVGSNVAMVLPMP